ncbi:hypothetical protein CPB86DRAFT_776284 [Serendipita vermifera]|nr:hypothetical protein CPB86DRAFT_776284 [Serendipita vermifera]
MSHIPGFGEIIESLVNLQASRYTCGAAMTVMFYDYLLTVGDEIKYVWSGGQKMSAVKFMFIWNRYFVFPWVILSNYRKAAVPFQDTDSNLRPILDLSGLRGRLSNRFCQVVIPAIAVVQGITIVIGIQLLALRVLALYKNDRRVRIGLFTWLAVCHTTLWVMVAVSMYRFVPLLIYLPVMNTCYTIADPIIGGVYIPPLLAEGGILILQIVDHIKRRKQAAMIKTPILTTLFRDGYLYFTAVISIRLLCVFVYAFGPTSLCALISRFFIQLRGAAVDEDSHYQSGRVGVGSATRYNQQAEHYPTDNFYLDDDDKVTRHEFPSPDSENHVQLQELRRMKTGRVPPRR